MNKVFDNKLGLFVSGVVLGLIAVVLAIGGNPGNMAFCIACFVRDIAGGLKLHQAGVVQYFRPEIAGLVVGSFVIAVANKEFKVTSGENPLQKFVLGACTMIMALVFLGCPLRMVIRMSGGDLNAYVAFVGFALGIVCGAIFLKNGYEMTDSKKEKNSLSGYILPILLVVGLILYNLPQTTELFAHSVEGPGAAHAAVAVAFVLAIAFGIIAQRASNESTAEKEQTIKIAIYNGDISKEATSATVTMTPRKANEILQDIYTAAFGDESQLPYSKAVPASMLDASGIINIRAFKEKLLSESWKYFDKKTLFDPITDVGFDASDFTNQWKEATQKMRELMQFTIDEGSKAKASESSASKTVKKKKA